MTAVTYLHDYRPVEPLHIVAHHLRVARDVMREAEAAAALAAYEVRRKG